MYRGCCPGNPWSCKFLVSLWEHFIVLCLFVCVCEYACAARQTACLLSCWNAPVISSPAQQTNKQAATAASLSRLTIAVLGSMGSCTEELPWWEPDLTCINSSCLPTPNIPSVRKYIEYLCPLFRLAVWTQHSIGYLFKIAYCKRSLFGIFLFFDPFVFHFYSDV